MPVKLPEFGPSKIIPPVLNGPRPAKSKRPLDKCLNWGEYAIRQPTKPL
jgi:hypothetical protein